MIKSLFLIKLKEKAIFIFIVCRRFNESIFFSMIKKDEVRYVDQCQC